MVDLPTKHETLKTLQQVKGIGPKIAAKIWAQFGTATPSQLRSDPDAVAAVVRGVSPKRAHAARTLFLDRSRGDSAAPESAAGDSTAIPWPSVPDRGISMDRLRAEVEARGNVFHQRRLHAETVLERHLQRLKTHPNVSGAHVGFRRRTNAGGEAMIARELEICIRVHVREKLAETDPRFADPRLAVLLDRQIEDVPVDVMASSYTTLDPPAEIKTAFVAGIENPIVGGIEIAAATTPTNRGTLGGIVRTGLRFRYITNQHVAGKAGSLVTQPAATDTSQIPAWTIGKVLDSEMPAGSETGSIDCAILQPDSPLRPFQRRIKGLQGPQRFENSFLSAPDVHVTKAIKVGAGTGQTSGIVKSVNAFVRIGSANMVQQIIVESEDNRQIIRGGDSGALLLTEMLSGDRQSVLGFNVVGLVHARSEDNTMMIATHFKAIADRFNVKV